MPDMNPLLFVNNGESVTPSESKSVRNGDCSIDLFNVEYSLVKSSACSNERMGEPNTSSLKSSMWRSSCIARAALAAAALASLMCFLDLALFFALATDATAATAPAAFFAADPPRGPAAGPSTLFLQPSHLQ